MPVKNRRLSKFIKRDMRSHRSHRYSKPVSGETHVPACLRESLLMKVNFRNASESYRRSNYGYCIMRERSVKCITHYRKTST